MGPLQNGSDIAVDITEDQFVDDDFGRIVDHIVVRLPSHALLTEDVAGFWIPRSIVIERLALISGDLEFDPGPPRGVAGGKFVTGLIDQRHFHTWQSGVEDEAGFEVQGLFLQHVQRAIECAVELGFRRGESEAVDIVPEHAEHVGVGPHEVVKGIRGPRLKPRVTAGDGDRVVDLGHVAPLAFLLFRSGLVNRVDPLVVGGLLDDRGTGVFALQIHAGRDEAVAGRTAL